MGLLTEAPWLLLVGSVDGKFFNLLKSGFVSSSIDFMVFHGWIFGDGLSDEFLDLIKSGSVSFPVVFMDSHG